MTAKEIAKRAWRNQIRNKGVRQKAGRIRELRNRDGHGVVINYDPKLNTMAWRFDAKKGKHRLTAGLEFRSVTDATVRSDDRKMFEFACSLLRHEADHGLFTDKDLDTIGKELAAEGIPFSLFNLFEDARIEYKDREEHKLADPTKPVAWFRWTRWTPNPDRTDKPEEYFWSMVNYEGSHRSSTTTTSWVEPGIKRWDTRAFIRNCYHRATAADTSRDLYPVLRDWVKRFGTKVELTPRGSDEIGGKGDPNKGEASGSGKIGSGYGYSEGEGNGEAVTEPPADIPTDLTKGPEVPVELQRDLKVFTKRFEDNPDYYSQEPYIADPNKVRSMIGRLSDMVKRADHNPAAIGTSGSRLHMPGVMVGGSQSFRQLKAGDGKRTVTVVMDMSGSMASRGGQAQEFMLAMAALHRRGLLDVRLWCSGGSKAAKVDMAWPVQDGIIKLRHTKGSESIAATLKNDKVRKDLQDSSVVIIYTDGQLTDGSVNAGEYRRHGVELIGALALTEYDVNAKGRGSDPTPYYRREMTTHFSRAIICENSERLAAELVNYVLKGGAK